MRGVGEDSFSKKGESSFLKVLVDLPIEIIMRKRNIKKKEYLGKDHKLIIYTSQKRVKTNMLNASHTFLLIFYIFLPTTIISLLYIYKILFFFSSSVVVSRLS